MKPLFALLLLTAPFLTTSTHAADSTYPSRAVRIIVPFPPAGTTDLMGRIVAQKLGEAWSQQVIVDNRGGAAGQIGAELAARSAPDGYTLFLGHIGTLGVNPGLYPKLRYDSLKDFAPISMIARVHNMLAVHPSLPVKTVKELVNLARARPGGINYGSAGAGSVSFLCMEYFKMLAKVNIVQVPYKGTGPMMIDLLAGNTSLTFTGIPSLLPHTQSGRLRAIAVGSEKRLPLLPNVPTVIESGVAGYEVVQWYGLLAPTGTPREIVMKINADMAKFLASPDMVQRMASEGGIPAPSTPEQFGILIKTEMERWAVVIKATGAKPD